MYHPADFAVIAAIDNPSILDANLRRSPDIADGTLPLVTIADARSMAEAYNAGLDRTAARICLLAHQDTYLPAGWLARAVEALNALTRDHPEWLVAGPHGVTRDGQMAGRIWDRTLRRELGSRLDQPVPVHSFDELLLILRRDEPFRFDEALPHFHLYGTDLAQTAWQRGRSAWALDLPVLHQNRPRKSLGSGYTRAYKYARRKWRDQLPIHTTVCPLTYNPIALWRVRWQMRHIARLAENPADAVETSRAIGYE